MLKSFQNRQDEAGGGRDSKGQALLLLRTGSEGWVVGAGILAKSHRSNTGPSLSGAQSLSL